MRASPTGVRRGIPLFRPIVSRSTYPGGTTPIAKRNLMGGFSRYFWTKWTMRRFTGTAYQPLAPELMLVPPSAVSCTSPISLFGQPRYELGLPLIVLDARGPVWNRYSLALWPSGASAPRRYACVRQVRGVGECGLFLRDSASSGQREPRLPGQVCAAGLSFCPSPREAARLRYRIASLECPFVSSNFAAAPGRAQPRFLMISWLSFT